MEQQIKEYAGLLDLLEDLEREGITGPQKTKAVADFLFIRARKAGIPYSGGFELTPLCNFNCKMCYVHLTREQMEKERQLLPVDAWIDIMRQAADAGMMYADLTGGECLTYPGFKEVYLYLLSRGVRVSILTNGYLLNREMIGFFQQYRPEAIQVSVYGSNRAAYLKVTGVDGFDQVMENLKVLRESGLAAKVVIMPHRYMQEDMREMLELVHQLDMGYSIGDVNLPPRDNTGRDYADFVADTGLAVRLKVLDIAYRAKHSEKWQYVPPYKFRVKGGETHGGIPCASGRCGFHVNWRGEVMPCIPYYKVNRSALTNGFMSAWNSVRQQMQTYQPPDECAACELRDRCTICPGEKTYGILNGPLNPLVCQRLQGILQALEQGGNPNEDAI